MDKPRQRRSAGPRSFDRNAAVATAMRLFRRYGYEGVSIADLTMAIGIAPPSLYAAFGSKAGLYREALALYASLPGALDGLEGAATLEDAVAGLLQAAIRAVAGEVSGCMISTGLLESAVEHRELARELAGHRRAARDNIANALRTWLDEPQAVRLAATLSAVLQGLSVQARDGATVQELSFVADEMVAGIAARTSLCNQQPSPPRSAAQEERAMPPSTCLAGGIGSSSYTVKAAKTLEPKVR